MEGVVAVEVCREVRWKLLEPPSSYRCDGADCHLLEPHAMSRDDCQAC